MFEPVAASANFPEQEERVLEFWRSRRIFEKSLEQRKGSPSFVFYEGPPTANGMPHPGHCLTRAIKDLFPRYRTMRGYDCQRKAGWDTHGLPVEVEVCKELGIHSKEEIEAFGIEPFIHRCQESVWRYMQEWERLTERIGFWIHLKDAYVTYHQSFVESVWWSLKKLFDKGLLYQGHKIVWWWAQGGTALSSGEVGQGYREVADPSVFVKFPLVEKPGVSLLVWTTTPWTLPSNQFAAVHPEVRYATVFDAEHNERLIVAEALVETLAGKVKRELVVEATMPGAELIGLRYVPPFDYYYKTLGEQMGKLMSGEEQAVAWRVVAADFVTIDSGTGVVHQAPAFGEVDFDLLQGEQARFQPGQGPQLICAVGPDGKFTTEAPDYHGRWVKEADKDISRELKAKKLLFHLEQYLHEYPFCWRADEDPLIQYPRRSWFIRTTQFKDRMLENNRQIGWLPEHIRDGRFGNFLESNVDWALSRERYWGTPLPIWVCEETGKMEAVADYQSLVSKPGAAGMEVWEAAKKAKPSLVDDLKIHKPYIDAITYDSPFAKGARMKRVSDVIDCWYDSGAMPFAQWGYPHAGQKQMADQFPADFISEALDQTRGWFYSQLAISTMLFGEGGAGIAEHGVEPWPHPFRNCIVLGLMLAETFVCTKCNKRFAEQVEACDACGGKIVRKTEKMSKKLRNYREPNVIFDNYGADALRWYFFANQPPWNSIVYSERAIKDSIPEFLLRLWNVYSFFVIYANIDGFDPANRFVGEVGEIAAHDLAHAAGYRPIAKRAELDRWLMGELAACSREVVARMDAYDNYGACQAIAAFVDGLSNWYVRRGRDRYWSSDKESPDKLDAYWTLYECLTTVSKLIAPFTPFLAETLWQNLAGVFGGRAAESVHLCDYPTGEASLIDEALSRRMGLLREIASLGLRARMENRLKVRQPLAKVEVILGETADQSWLAAHDALLRDELNVRQVDYTSHGEQYIDYQVRPNFKLLGPKLGKRMPAVKALLEKADGAALMAQMQASGCVELTVDGEPVRLESDVLEVRLNAKPGWAAAQGRNCVVVLATDLTPELIREGMARDVVRLIQDHRKETGCQYTDRIEIGLVTDSAELRAAIEENRDYIMGETLALKLVLEPLAGVEGVEREIGEAKVIVYVRVVKGA